MSTKAPKPTERAASASAETASTSEAVLPVRTIVVGVDLSKVSHPLIRRAYGVISGRAGVVHLVHIAHPRAKASDAELLAELNALIPSPALEGVVTQPHVIRSDQIVGPLCAAAERFKADLLCLATHGDTGITKGALGPVAEEVIECSLTPILLMRPNAS
jgi:nucleotide-binding universal stress UspA family protein